MYSHFKQPHARKVFGARGAIFSAILLLYFFTKDPYIYMAKVEKKLQFPVVCLICIFAAVVSVKGRPLAHIVNIFIDRSCLH